MTAAVDHPNRSKLLGRPWVVPAAITTVVLATAVAVPLIADADSELPERSAAEVVADLAEAPEVPFAGTLVYSADLGLPDLTAVAGGDSSALALLSGATTARIWYTDLETYRLALHGELSEVDLIRDGERFWYWDSEANHVTEMEAPEDSGNPIFDADVARALSTSGMTAELVLRWLDPSTQVSVDGTATVAGRAAYELVIRPRDDRSLIGSIRVAVDGEYGVPLRIQIHGADGGDPAIEVGFTSVSFDEPDPSVYQFTPPPGATSEEFDLGTWWDEAHPDGDPFDGPHFADKHADADVDVEVVGEGWTSVVIVDGFAPELLATGMEGLSGEFSEYTGEIDALIEVLIDELRPMSGPYGIGVGFESRLLSVLWLEDGRLLIGAVGLEILEEAAS